MPGRRTNVWWWQPVPKMVPINSFPLCPPIGFSTGRWHLFLCPTPRGSGLASVTHWPVRCSGNDVGDFQGQVLRCHTAPPGLLRCSEPRDPHTWWGHPSPGTRCEWRSCLGYPGLEDVKQKLFKPPQQGPQTGWHGDEPTSKRSRCFLLPLNL